MGSTYKYLYVLKQNTRIYLVRVDAELAIPKTRTTTTTTQKNTKIKHLLEKQHELGYNTTIKHDPKVRTIA